MSMDPLNQTILRCSACGSCLRQYWLRFSGWVAGLQWMAYIGVLSVCNEFFFGDLPGMSFALFSLLFSYAFFLSVNRLYHAWWGWRHPVRCQGGGHVES